MNINDDDDDSDDHCHFCHHTDAAAVEPYNVIEQKSIIIFLTA